MMTKPKPLLYDRLFGPDGEEENALRSALRTAAESCGYEGEYAEYEFIEKTPRTSLTCHIIMALHRHGYEIRQKPTCTAFEEG